MEYKKCFKKIMEILSEHRAVVDKLAKSYQEEIRKHEEHVQSMAGVYTEEFIEEARAKWKPTTVYGGAINISREKCQKDVDVYLEKIKRELNSYFGTPANSEFSAMVSALKITGAKISNREFDALRGACDGFWSLKLLETLAMSRTKKERQIKVERRNTESANVDTLSPYILQGLPNIADAYNKFDDMKHSVYAALADYCGPNRELKSFVFPEDGQQEKARITAKNEYGADVKNDGQNPNTMEIVRTVRAARCMEPEHITYTEFLAVMDSLNATIPKPEPKTRLTSDEIALINAMIDPKFKSLAQKNAIEIAKRDERMAELLRIDPRYGKVINEALEGEGNRNA